jgi:hypothetical protein
MSCDALFQDEAIEILSLKQHRFVVKVNLRLRFKVNLRLRSHLNY